MYISLVGFALWEIWLSPLLVFLSFDEKGFELIAPYKMYREVATKAVRTGIV